MIPQKFPNGQRRPLKISEGTPQAPAGTRRSRRPQKILSGPQKFPEGSTKFQREAGGCANTSTMSHVMFP